MKLPSLRLFLKNRHYPLLLVVCGVIGLVAAFILSIDAIAIAKNPDQALNCNINPIISCGSVMKTPEASLFGFANSLLGIPAFTAVLTIGAIALAGTVLSKWIWRGLLAGSVFGVIFVHYLFYQSVFNIHALCPYCMVVWVVTMLVFWYTLIFNLQRGYLGDAHKGIVAFMRRHHLDLYLTWALTITAIILARFWYFFRTVI